jgi:hypothetical protein
LIGSRLHLEAHRAERWIRFSHPKDAPVESEHRIDSESGVHFWFRGSSILI